MVALEAYRRDTGASSVTRRALTNTCIDPVGRDTVARGARPSMRASPTRISPTLSLRLVANAAGPLPHHVALSMRATYGEACFVLPSYGMTECMPISSPPAEYTLDRPGTSGRVVGPQVRTSPPPLSLWAIT